MNDDILNGGFPPLILKKNIKKNNKERLFSSNIKYNINIKEILESKKKTFLINNNKNNINIINNL